MSLRSLLFVPADNPRKIAKGEGTGTVGLDGRMLDRPHLVAAKRLLTTVGDKVLLDAH